MSSKRTKLIAISMLAAAAVGSMGSAEARGMKKLSGLDTNENGAISPEELVAAAAATVAEKQAKFLERYDADEDGAVSNEESLAVSQAAVSKHFERILGRFDSNEDGEIDSEDDRPFRGRYGRRFFAALDLDDDGVITGQELVDASEAEVQRLHNRFLEKYDTDEDGNVSAEESLAVLLAAAEERTMAILERYDTDENGTISAEEIAAKESRSRGRGRHFRR